MSGHMPQQSIITLHVQPRPSELATDEEQLEKHHSSYYRKHGTMR